LGLGLALLPGKKETVATSKTIGAFYLNPRSKSFSARINAPAPEKVEFGKKYFPKVRNHLRDGR
jgi:hypothetical protein